MKIIALLFSALLIISSTITKPVQDQKNPRFEKIIDSQWTFNYFPVTSIEKGFETPGFDDSRWPVVSIPHTWTTYETTGELLPAETDNDYWSSGCGWYRKHFSLNKDYSSKELFIEFKGVQGLCKVWINGNYLGEHTGSFGPFDFNLSPFIKPGTDNVIAVSVNNYHPNSEPDFSDGGIFGDVKLVLREKLFIPMQGSANHEGGTSVTTPVISDNEAVVKIQTWVQNDNGEKADCILLTSVIDSSGSIVQTIKTESTINPGELFMFDQTGKIIKNPHLWSPESPYIYKVSSQVFSGKVLTDQYSSFFGFRRVAWDDNDKSLLVNGKKIILTGGECKKRYLWLGTAVPRMLRSADIQDISENLKYNFLRATKPDDRFYFDLTDKYGIISEVSLPAVRGIGKKDQCLREMIRAYRNNPGVILWNTGPGGIDSVNGFFDGKSRLLNKVISNLNTNSITSSGANAINNEPVKLMLSAGMAKISADRGNIAIITADITDKNGNHLSSTAQTVKWSVTGPAALVGPSIFESGNKDHSGAESWYTDFPAINIIRSNGKAGKIRVSASSGGLISGIIELMSEEIPDDNSVISEPRLRDGGRLAVAKNVLHAGILNEVPRVLNMTSDDLNFSNADKPGYMRSVREYIFKNNPGSDTSTLEFRMLTSLLATQLVNSDGHLMAMDYNFNIDHFNNYHLISGYINSTKLPVLFKDALKKYYSEAIIKKGGEKNAGDEMNWMNWIPSGGTVVFIQPEKQGPVIKGALISHSTRLEDIISVVYPQFASFSGEAKERAIIFISKMNPYIHKSADKTGSSSSYAEKGQAVLIPLLKFISE